MAGQHPSDVDVTLTDPAAIVHTVADFLAGRCVQLAWATDVVTLWDPSPDARGSLGVYVAAAEVLGCSMVVSDRSLCMSCEHPDTGDFLRVSWVELLAIRSAFGGEQSFALRGHSVEITTLVGSWSNALTRSVPAETHPNMLRHRTPVLCRTMSGQVEEAGRATRQSDGRSDG